MLLDTRHLVSPSAVGLPGGEVALEIPVDSILAVGLFVPLVGCRDQPGLGPGESELPIASVLFSVA